MTNNLTQKIVFFIIGLFVAYFCFLFSYTIFHDANKFTLNYVDYSYCLILGAISILIGLLILVFVVLSAVSPKYSAKISDLFTK
jgi:hypothetical protein